MPSQKPPQLKQPEIGRFVRELRQSTGLTQEQFGKKIGVSYETVCRWENGKMQPSSLALKQLEQTVKEFVDLPDQAMQDRAIKILSQYFSKNLNIGQ